MHPSYNVKKIYKVELDRPLTRADFKRLQEGVHLEEAKAQVDDCSDYFRRWKNRGTGNSHWMESVS